MLSKLESLKGNNTAYNNSKGLIPNYNFNEIPEYNATLPEIMEIVKAAKSINT
jgi:hypothetical protein